MRMYLVKLLNGNWYSHISPGGRQVSVDEWPEARFFREENYGDVEEVIAANPGATVYETIVEEPHTSERDMDVYADYMAQKLNLGVSTAGTEQDLTALESRILKYAAGDGDGMVMPLIYIESEPDCSLDQAVNAIEHLMEMNYMRRDGGAPSPSTFYELTEQGRKAAKV